MNGCYYRKETFKIDKLCDQMMRRLLTTFINFLSPFMHFQFSLIFNFELNLLLVSLDLIENGGQLTVKIYFLDHVDDDVEIYNDWGLKINF